jgi:hypothetical protein
LCQHTLLFSFRSYNDSSSRSHGGGGSGGGNNGGGNNGSNLECHNTYGLSVKFLEGLGITQGPLHNKVFVANVSISCCSFHLSLLIFPNLSYFLHHISSLTLKY